MNSPFVEPEIIAGLTICGTPGSRGVVRRVSSVPSCAVRFWFHSGTRLEDIPGQTAITGRMLSEGTTTRSWQELAEFFENRGVAASSFGTREAHGLTLDLLSADLDEALDWMFEMILESSFPRGRHEWMVEQAISELLALKDQPDTQTLWAFYRQLYTPHPAARPTLGTQEGLAQLTPEDCARFHRQSLARGVSCSVAGDLDVERVAAKLDGFLKALPDFQEEEADAAEAQIKAPSSLLATEGSEQVLGTGVEDQTHLYLGHLTVPIHHPDVLALEVAGIVLGAGSGLMGRIPARIREQAGLAYTAQAATLAGAGRDPGRFVIYLATSPEFVDQALDLVREELKRFLCDGPTQEEFDDAVAYLRGREPFRRETARQWADVLADSLFYRLPLWDGSIRLGRLEALTLEQVRSAVEQHLSADRLHLTCGGRRAARTASASAASGTD